LRDLCHKSLLFPHRVIPQIHAAQKPFVAFHQATAKIVQSAKTFRRFRICFSHLQRASQVQTGPSFFYPCNIKGNKTIDLAETDLTEWLKSEEAHSCRVDMKNCDINCGWYQYYSIDSYLSPKTVGEALKPNFKRK